jgi:hypothetical protein
MPIGKVALPLQPLLNKYDIIAATVTRNTETEFTVHLTAEKTLPLVVEVTPTLELTVYIKEKP